MRKKILISILSTLALGALVCSGAFIKNNANEIVSVQAEAVRTSALIAEKYVIGDSIELPKDATLEYGGKNYSATVTLRDPDGRGYTNEQVLLNIL